MPRAHRRPGPAHLASLALDPASPEPLYRQLYFAIREAILTGRLQPGARLPATRTLARDLGVSRNTVLAAFEQLAAEGYLGGRVGAGSFVSRCLPEEASTARAAPGHFSASPAQATFQIGPVGLPQSQANSGLMPQAGSL